MSGANIKFAVWNEQVSNSFGGRNMVIVSDHGGEADFFAQIEAREKPECLFAIMRQFAFDTARGFTGLFGLLFIKQLLVQLRLSMIFFACTAKEKKLFEFVHF